MYAALPCSDFCLRLADRADDENRALPLGKYARKTKLVCKRRDTARKELPLSNVRDSLVKNKNSEISFYNPAREIRLAYSRLIFRIQFLFSLEINKREKIVRCISDKRV